MRLIIRLLALVGLLVLLAIGGATAYFLFIANRFSDKLSCIDITEGFEDAAKDTNLISSFEHTRSQVAIQAALMYSSTRYGTDNSKIKMISEAGLIHHFNEFNSLCLLYPDKKIFNILPTSMTPNRNEIYMVNANINNMLNGVNLKLNPSISAVAKTTFQAIANNQLLVIGD